MAEQGKITISVGVDSGQAIDGLKDLQDGLKDMGDTSGKAGAKVVDSFEDIDKAAKDSAKAVDKSSSSAQKAMKETAKVAQKSGKETTDAMDQADTIQGLDSLQDKTGELDSSLKGLAGAVGLVSPEMEMLLMRTGDLSGGFEASARLSKLAGGSMKSLMIAGGTLGVAVAALGGTWAIMSRKVAAAEERLAEAHEEMVEGIAFAKQYKDQLQGLQNSVGLLSDEEFALIDARRRSNEFMKEEIEGQRAQRIVVNQISSEIERLREQFVNFADKQKLMPGVNDEYTISLFNVAEAIEKTNEQLEAGEEVLADNGRQSETYSTAQMAVSDAVQMVEDNIESLEGSLARYQKEIDGTERKTERLNLLMQIQAAQARDDRQAVAELAMSLAVLSDTETLLFKATINAAKAQAIMQTQLANLGPATGAAIAGIERLFAKYEETHAPQAFQQTLANLNTKLEDNATATANATAATENSTEATEEEIDAQGARMRAADMLAEARGAEAQVEREYAKAIQEVNALRVQGAITEEETTELILASFQKRSDAMDELKKKRDDMNKEEQLSLQDYAKAVQAVGDLTGNALAMISEDIDQREAESLARAEGNLERQEEIRKEFDAQRQRELTNLFKASQATAIAGALMSGAQAAVAALAPPSAGGFGPKLGLAMMPILAGITATQIATIAQQKPSFHQGGMIGGQGDQMITAQGGEAVLNRAAVASLGGESGVDSLNAGGAAGGAVVVQMVYKQRVLDELIVDNLAKGGPLKRAINDSSRRARRGRIGGRL